MNQSFRLPLPKPALRDSLPPRAMVPMKGHSLCRGTPACEDNHLHSACCNPPPVQKRPARMSSVIRAVCLRLVCPVAVGKPLRTTAWAINGKEGRRHPETPCSVPRHDGRSHARCDPASACQVAETESLSKQGKQCYPVLCGNRSSAASHRHKRKTVRYISLQVELANRSDSRGRSATHSCPTTRYHTHQPQAIEAPRVFSTTSGTTPVARDPATS